MVLDEFLIALGLKVDSSDIARAEQLGQAVDDIGDNADNASRGLGRAYEATDGFVSSIEGALGVLGFFTGVIGGAFAFFHSTISDLEDLIKEEKLLTDVTKEQIKQAKVYNESVETLGKRFNSLKVDLAFGFLPTLQGLITGFDEFLKVNKDLIVNGLTTLINSLVSVIQVVINFTSFIDMIVSNTLGWERTLYLLAAAFLFVRRAMILAFVLSPVGLLVIAIGGLLILIDDFITYLKGGESEFGEFWGAMLEYIEEITPTLQYLWDLLKQGGAILLELGTFIAQYFGGGLLDLVQSFIAAWNLIIGIFTGNTELIKVSWDALIENLLSAFNNFSALFGPLAEVIVTVFSSVFDKAKAYVINVFNSIVNAVSAFVSRIGAALGNVFNVITSPFRIAFEWIVNTFNKLPSLIGNIVSKLPGVNAISAIGSAVSTGARRITNNYGGATQATINVNAPNATSAANQVASALNNTQAQRNFGGAVQA